MVGLPGAARYQQALTPPGAGVLTLTRPGRGESQTDSDDESNFYVEVRDADETTDDPDILTLLEEDLKVGERLGPAVVEKLGTIARGRFTVRLPEQKPKDKLGKYPPPENCQELKTPVLNAELGGKGFLDCGAKKSDWRSVKV